MATDMKINLAGTSVGELSDTVVALEAGCSSRTVARYRRAHGIPPAPSTRQGNGVLPVSRRTFKQVSPSVVRNGQSVSVGASLLHGLDRLGLLRGESRAQVVRRLLREVKVDSLVGRTPSAEEACYPRQGPSGRLSLALDQDEWGHLGQIALACRLPSYSAGLRVLLEYALERTEVPTLAAFEARAVEVAAAHPPRNFAELAGRMGLTWGKGSGKGIIAQAFTRLEKSGQISFALRS